MYNPMVRVKGEVEELVREVAKSLGYSPFSVRNTAILYGLAHIVSLGKVPESDQEFLELLSRISKLVGKPIQTQSSRYVRYVRKRRKLGEKSELRV